ncbi:MAG: iron-sulfur cluster carrier protein ApbC [Gammaproteobacteria bacterium]|nr:iron-sulfur cluster carrier protein ApbC [Gammaproteobacteria bacterium]
MTNLSQENVEKLLSTVVDKHTSQDIVSSKSIKAINIEGNKLNIEVILKYPANSYHDELKRSIQAVLSDSGASELDISISSKITSHATQNGANALPSIKNIIAVASGKGGVGKSTTSVNLALALHSEGAKVAILDADIYGPSQPRMLGVKDLRPEGSESGNMMPVPAHGIQSMSIGYLVDEASPMVWRGPMVTQALDQLISKTEWSDIDYMIIDMPPGTGDIQLTISQKIPVSGAVIVTTPQDIALLDAKKGLAMFEKVNIPILGIIENMSMHICSSCGHAEAIFGHGGGENMASDSGTEFLGALPLEINIRTDVDEGTPTVVKDPQGKTAEIYKEIARKLAASLSLQNESVGAFPNITIE